MTKQEVAEYLTKIGFPARVSEDGAVELPVDVPMRRKQKDCIRNRLQSIGYRGKWRWKITCFFFIKTIDICGAVWYN